MIIRKATESDIPAIIGLLRLSLGETLLPKSEALWRWKHLENPFGPSPCLLAEEDGQLLGVRAFLRWDYRENGKIYHAYRAVDTATHPQHQGKGIFKKLTLDLLSRIQTEGADFVYNTPNANSTPGYLKMGWEKWGKLPLKLSFHFSQGKKTESISPTDWSALRGLIERIESGTESIGLQTHLQPGYLSWRYENCPLFPYQVISDGEEYLLIYRIKEGKMGRELRIADLFLTDRFSAAGRKSLNRALKSAQKQSGARYTSFSGLDSEGLKALDLGILPILSLGPIVTLRCIKPSAQVLDRPWHWSLGDLEVF
jgi:GNAT superfamily N-acetyltransferase